MTRRICMLLAVSIMATACRTTRSTAAVSRSESEATAKVSDVSDSAAVSSSVDYDVTDTARRSVVTTATLVVDRDSAGRVKAYRFRAESQSAVAARTQGCGSEQHNAMRAGYRTDSMTQRHSAACMSSERQTRTAWPSPMLWLLITGVIAITVFAFIKKFYPK